MFEPDPSNPVDLLARRVQRLQDPLVQTLKTQVVDPHSALEDHLCRNAPLKKDLDDQVQCWRGKHADQIYSVDWRARLFKDVDVGWGGQPHPLGFYRPTRMNLFGRCFSPVPVSLVTQTAITLENCGTGIKLEKSDLSFP